MILFLSKEAENVICEEKERISIENSNAFQLNFVNHTCTNN